MNHNHHQPATSWLSRLKVSIVILAGGSAGVRQTGYGPGGRRRRSINYVARSPGSDSGAELSWPASLGWAPTCSGERTDGAGPICGRGDSGTGWCLTRDYEWHDMHGAVAYRSSNLRSRGGGLEPPARRGCVTTAACCSHPRVLTLTAFVTIWSRYTWYLYLYWYNVVLGFESGVEER